MATVTKGRTFVSGETVTPAKLNELVDNATVTSIVDADVSASAAIALSKLATGALPTGITVASTNLVDGTIGAGQTWQNMSSSRAIPASAGAFYTNTTGRPIAVNIRFTANPPVLVSLELGSVGVVAWAQSGVDGVRHFVSAIIPAGETYRAVATFGGLVEWFWFELR